MGFVVSLVMASIAAPPTPEQVFEQRILPIFNSPNPSSCVQCHLAGVDLKNYIRPSSTETFLSLRDQGLIDLDAPEKSRILALIAMGQDEKGTPKVSQKARDVEYQAFAAWVKAAASDPLLRTAPKLKPDALAKPTRPNEIIRHARKDRLLESFENTIWAMRFRCMNCHIENSPQARKLIEEHGKQVGWFKATPEATLNYLMGSKLIDVKKPENSLLLLKPLEAVKHAGGEKFVVGDQGYKAFRQFLEDYANIVGDKYDIAAKLPKLHTIEAFSTDIWLKLTNTAPDWDMKLLMVKVFAWDATTKTWETDPIATSDRRGWAKYKLWQHSLTVMAPKDSDRAKAWKTGTPSLANGRYLVKVYVDGSDKLAKDWTAELSETDFVGSAEVQSAWPPGYGKMTPIDAGKLTKE